MSADDQVNTWPKEANRGAQRYVLFVLSTSVPQSRRSIPSPSTWMIFECALIRELSIPDSKKAKARSEESSMEQGECARCGRKVRNEENYLKAHLWAASAVFHWPRLIALMKEPGEMAVEDATCKTRRVTRV
jgi:hypothetical protein